MALYKSLSGLTATRSVSFYTKSIKTNEIIHNTNPLLITLIGSEKT